MLNKSRRRDPWFLDDYTINPYSGCSFNCLYCYIRGSKFGIHMEEKTSIKSNALEILEKQLSSRARRDQQGIIVLSSATDPYLQFEKEEQLTRRILELILKYRFPVHIITKSDLVVRDFDLLKKIEEQAILPKDLQGKLEHKVMISFSFSTLDPFVASIFEPGATPPAKRLEALKASLGNGFHSGVSLMPLLPFISDTSEQLQHLFNTFSEAKVKYIFPATLTLFGDGTADSKTLVLRAVEKHFPHLLEKYDRFFQNSQEMPAYYREAFYKKMKELCLQYELKDRIF